MSTKTCSTHGTFTPNADGRCPECCPPDDGIEWHPRKQIRYHRRLVAKTEKQYADWKWRISTIPTPIRTLTEEEWLAVCKRFNGCALCNTASIDARGMFIQFDEGGRYAAWNIIPICEKCATEAKAQPNVFRRLNGNLNANLDKARGLGTKKLQEVVAYLDEKIEEALR